MLSKEEIKKEVNMNEDKIEIGEYVKTKNGYIRKVVKEFDKNTSCYIVDKPYYNEKILETTKGIVLKEDIVEHSKNIMDLIQINNIVQILVNEVNGFTIVFQITNEKQLKTLKEMEIKVINVWQEWSNEVTYEIAKRNRKNRNKNFSDWKIPNKLKTLMEGK